MQSVMSSYGPYLGKTISGEELAEVAEDLAGGFSHLLGLVFDYVSPDKVVAHVEVGPQLTQPMGIVHGGLFCSLVEDVGSLAAWWWLGGRGLAVGSSNSTDFFRPVTEGVLTAVARPLHRGKTQQVWIVDITRDDGKLAAQGRLRLSNLMIPDEDNGASS